MHKGQKSEDRWNVNQEYKFLDGCYRIYLGGFSRAKISRKIRLEGEREVRVVNQKTGRSVGPQSLISCASVIYTVTVYVQRDYSSADPFLLTYLLACLVIFPFVERPCSKINKQKVVASRRRSFSSLGPKRKFVTRWKI